MLKIDDGTKRHEFSSIDELFKFIDEVEVSCLCMTTPNGRIWNLRWVCTAGKSSAKMICLSPRKSGLEHHIESLEDIFNFLDNVPMSSLVLQARHKVFDITFAGLMTILKIDDGSKEHDVCDFDELSKLIKEVTVTSLRMTTPDGRLWDLYQGATATSTRCQMYCTYVSKEEIGDGGLECDIGSLEDITDFLASSPTMGLGLIMLHKVFEISFVGFTNRG